MASLHSATSRLLRDGASRPPDWPEYYIRFLGERRPLAIG